MIQQNLYTEPGNPDNITLGPTVDGLFYEYHESE